MASERESAPHRHRRAVPGTASKLRGISERNKMPDWETAHAADIGARAEQQDRVAIFERGGEQLLVLADGMGGHQGGAEAAQAVIDATQSCWGALETAVPIPDGQRSADIDTVSQPQANSADKSAALVTSALQTAHSRINAVDDARRISSHSTGVVLHLQDGVATWAHVGDSRLYHLRNGQLAERTLDHSIVETMRLQGRITEEEMKTHPDQNRLFAALGGKKPPEPEVGQTTTTVQDGFLLASDGLWENVHTAELEAVFAAKDLRQALADLIHSAKRRGGNRCDNISVAVARRQVANS